MKFDIPISLHILIQSLLKQHPNEVDLIFRYGSTVTGKNHEASDIDIAWVPSAESCWGSITVELAGTLIDLFPLHWSRLTRMASREDSFGAILLQAQIVYAKSPEVEKRFHELSHALRRTLLPTALPAMFETASRIFQATGYTYFLLTLAARRGIRIDALEAAETIYQSCLHCLAIINQAIIDPRCITEVLALKKLPKDFSYIVDQMMKYEDPQEILDVISRLMDGLRDLLLSEQNGLLKNPLNDDPVFYTNDYPEMANDLRHMTRACAKKDTFALRRIYFIFNKELAGRLAKIQNGKTYSNFHSLSEYILDVEKNGFPNLQEAVIHQDWDLVNKGSIQTIQSLKAILNSMGIGLNSFKTTDELKIHLG